MTPKVIVTVVYDKQYILHLNCILSLESPRVFNALYNDVRSDIQKKLTVAVPYDEIIYGIYTVN